jgi:DNA-binding IclR family transcriptional regulator
VNYHLELSNNLTLKNNYLRKLDEENKYSASPTIVPSKLFDEQCLELSQKQTELNEKLSELNRETVSLCVLLKRIQQNAIEVNNKIKLFRVEFD